MLFCAPLAIQTALRSARPSVQVSARLAYLRDPPGSLHGPRQRFHLAAHRASGGRSQDSADLLHRREARGRGKLERFFRSLSQVFLSRLPGYAPGRTRGSAVLTLPELDQELERYLISQYLVTPHAPPDRRRNPAGMPAGFSRRWLTRSNDSIRSCSPCPSLAASIKTASGSWGCATSIRRWPRTWERTSCCATTPRHGRDPGLL